MGFFKKNPIFCVFVLLCLLVFAGGAYFAWTQNAKVARAQNQVKSAESQLKTFLHADPAPSVENVERSAANVRALREELSTIRENLQRGARLTTSEDGVRVMASIQQFIGDFQNRARSHTREIAEEPVPSPIQTPANFAFGFELYIDEATPPTDPKTIALLDKQRQILIYVLNQLIASNPKSIQSIEREVVERPAAAPARQPQRGGGQSGGGFSINPAASARVPGAIDTLAFKVTYTGYTDALREFLNRLSAFDLPIVVRSVEVSRPAAPRAEAQRPTRGGGGGLDDIFGVFGGGGTEAPETPAPREAQKPVISENLSTFSVTLEFIEIVLPADSGENPS